MGTKSGIIMLLLLAVLAERTLAIPTTTGAPEENDEEVSRKILGSSVVTSVSVIMDVGNGSQTYFSDSVGKPVNKPFSASQLASPINLLNPDRYEFYTFDDNGDLVKRLMTLQEIQSIIASGDGESGDQDANPWSGPAKKVNDVVNNVQNVLKEEMAAHKTATDRKPIFDSAPQISSNWNLIIPPIFNNIAGDEFADLTTKKVVEKTTENFSSTGFDLASAKTEAPDLPETEAVKEASKVVEKVTKKPKPTTLKVKYTTRPVPATNTVFEKITTETFTEKPKPTTLKVKYTTRPASSTEKDIEAESTVLISSSTLGNTESFSSSPSPITKLDTPATPGFSTASFTTQSPSTLQDLDSLPTNYLFKRTNEPQETSSSLPSTQFKEISTYAVESKEKASEVTTEINFTDEPFDSKSTLYVTSRTTNRAPTTINNKYSTIKYDYTTAREDTTEEVDKSSEIVYDTKVSFLPEERTAYPVTELPKTTKLDLTTRPVVQTTTEKFLIAPTEEKLNESLNNEVVEDSSTAVHFTDVTTTKPTTEVESFEVTQLLNQLLQTTNVFEINSQLLNDVNDVTPEQLYRETEAPYTAANENEKTVPVEPVFEEVLTISNEKTTPQLSTSTEENVKFSDRVQFSTSTENQEPTIDSTQNFVSTENEKFELLTSTENFERIDTTQNIVSTKKEQQMNTVTVKEITPAVVESTTEQLKLSDMTKIDQTTESFVSTTETTKLESSPDIDLSTQNFVSTKNNFETTKIHQTTAADIDFTKVTDNELSLAIHTLISQITNEEPFSTNNQEFASTEEINKWNTTSSDSQVKNSSPIPTTDNNNYETTANNLAATTEQYDGILNLNNLLTTLTLESKTEVDILPTTDRILPKETTVRSSFTDASLDQTTNDLQELSSTSLNEENSSESSSLEIREDTSSYVQENLSTANDSSISSTENFNFITAAISNDNIQKIAEEVLEPFLNVATGSAGDYSDFTSTENVEIYSKSTTPQDNSIFSTASDSQSTENLFEEKLYSTDKTEQSSEEVTDAPKDITTSKTFTDVSASTVQEISTEKVFTEIPILKPKESSTQQVFTKTPSFLVKEGINENVYTGSPLSILKEGTTQNSFTEIPTTTLRESSTHKEFTETPLSTLEEASSQKVFTKTQTSTLQEASTQKILFTETPSSTLKESNTQKVFTETPLSTLQEASSQQVFTITESSSPQETSTQKAFTEIPISTLQESSTQKVFTEASMSTLKESSTQKVFTEAPLTTLKARNNTSDNFVTVSTITTSPKNYKQPEYKIILNTTSTTSTVPPDTTWTLVSTVTPHKTTLVDSSNKEVNSSTHQGPTSVDLVPRPVHGYGLEDSTSSLDADIFQFAELCNELAFSFWSSVTTGISFARSVVVSPFATTSMLAMVFLGAKGSTSGEMNDILKLDDMVTFNPHAIFKSVVESIEVSKKSGVAVSVFAKELFSDKNKGKLLSFYKDRVKLFYDGHVEEVNFREINDVIRRRTNLLVKRETWGKIPEYLKDNNLFLRPPLAAISANIFQTDCSEASTEGRDGELHFVVLPSIRQRKLIPIPAVVWRSNFLAGYDPALDATAVAIGTKESTISTIFVIPGQQGISAPGDGLLRLENRLVENAYRQNAWNRLLRSLIPRPGLEVQIPRFSHKSIINATMALQRMGLKDLFSSQAADLKGLNGVAHEYFLSDIVQVNTFATCGEGTIEQGHHSEIYPATTNRSFRRIRKIQHRQVDNGDGSEEPRDYQRAFHDPLFDPSNLALPLHVRPRQARIPDAPRLRFDRPFLYFVRHNPTGLILHMGRFNPRLLP